MPHILINASIWMPTTSPYSAGSKILLPKIFELNYRTFIFEQTQYDRT